ncbi:MAG TPA: phage holin family protein [Gammaproteobacteria bacterium]|nr:phage holin family protein [Gammaproteobacteria bacterium]
MEGDTDSSPEPSPGPIGSLFRSLRNLLATAVAIGHTRLELLSTELQREIHQAAEILLWAAVALLAAGIGLFLLAILVVFVFWDTHRMLASVVVTAVFFAMAATATLVLRAKIRNKPRLLDGTLTELAKDRAGLAARATKDDA